MAPSATDATIRKNAALNAALARVGGGGAAATALAALAKGTQGEDSAAEALSHRATHLNLQAVIFHAAEYVNGPKVSVVGTCVVLDVALGRLDLSSNGAKLIVKLTEETSEALAAGRLGIGSELCVTGALRKEGRRLFLHASELRAASG